MKTFVAILIITAAVDKPLIDAVQRNRSHFSDEFARYVTPAGGHDALLASVALLGGGWVLHDVKLRDTGRDAIEAQLVAGGIVTPLLKRAFGRARPFTGEGTYHFDPFRSRDDEHRSFPSGHATTAFATATAIAEHYHNRAVPIVVYSIAAGVAFARVNDNVHFPSDVVAGALIGHLAGREIVAHHGIHIIPQRHGIAIFYRSAGE